MITFPSELETFPGTWHHLSGPVKSRRGLDYRLAYEWGILCRFDEHGQQEPPVPQLVFTVRVQGDHLEIIDYEDESGLLSQAEDLTGYIEGAKSFVRENMEAQSTAETAW